MLSARFTQIGKISGYHEQGSQINDFQNSLLSKKHRLRDASLGFDPELQTDRIFRQAI